MILNTTLSTKKILSTNAQAQIKAPLFPPPYVQYGIVAYIVLWSKNSLLTTPRALSADPDPEGDESDDEDYPEGAEPAGDDEEDAK
jgi:hypothetical protein